MSYVMANKHKIHNTVRQRLILKKQSIHLASQYLLAAILACAIFIMVTHAWHLSLSTPFAYWGDSIFSGALVKSVIDTGWYMSNPYLGAPNGYYLGDFPLGADNFHFIIIKLLSYFTPHYAVVLNVFYILTFPTVALSALFVLKRLGLSYYPYALVGSLLFTALPYHFYRGEWHLFLSSYYIVPLAIWLAVSVADGRVNARRSLDWKQYCIYGILCLLLGSSGIYYALFGIFFIMCAGVLAVGNIKKLEPLWRALILSGFIFSTLLLNLSPTLLYHSQYGPNNQVSARHANESEVYGLKIVQMLLPVDNDRLPFMAKLKSQYTSSAFLNTENNYASLGIVGGVGFCILLAILVLGLKVSNELSIISKLNLCGVLIGTIGGFGTLFAYTISPTIRCYNRISIFIAFFSIYTFFYFMQWFTHQYDFLKKPIIQWVLILILLGAGVLNQSSNNFILSKDNHPLVAKFSDDEVFVRNIEKIIPLGSMVYQLPYLAFPEHGNLVSMLDYNHFRPYLHSKTLKWSYGAMKNRPVAAWQERVSSLSVEGMLKQLSYAGYQGIYIDRNGYEDHGVNIEKQLKGLLGVAPLISPDGHLSFFDFRSFVNHLKKAEPLSLWSKHVQEVKNQLSLSFSWKNGCYDLEKNPEMTWHWCQKKSTISFVNESGKSISVKINFKLLTNETAFSTLTLTSTSLNKEFKINNQGVKFSSVITLPPGEYNLDFYSDANRVDAPQDPRELYFRIANFDWQIIS
jgi:hypothetical protein